jgi:hypothetical protein
MYIYCEKNITHPATYHTSDINWCLQVAQDHEIPCLLCFQRANGKRALCLPLKQTKKQIPTILMKETKRYWIF